MASAAVTNPATAKPAAMSHMKNTWPECRWTRWLLFVEKTSLRISAISAVPIASTQNNH